MKNSGTRQKTKTSLSSEESYGFFLCQSEINLELPEISILHLLI